MKRICFCGHFSAGGTEKAAFMIANGLSEKYEVFFVNTGPKPPTFYLDEKISMYHLPEGHISNRIIKLASYLKKKKTDVLISVEAMTGIYTIIAAKLAKCNHIVWEHANYYQNQGSRHIQKIRQLELKTADAYIVLTQRDMKNFSDHFKISCKLDYIYNPIDKGSNNKYDLNSKKIVSIGHIRKIKNFLVIPDVARCVFDKHPDWTWEIYGSYRTERNEELNYYNELKAKIEEYGLKDKVILCGRTDDTSSVYDSAAIYVMTSLQEGLPMVLLEAKAHNLPIVSFDIETGPEEIVDDCVNGYLIEPYDVERMAERICDLIKDEKLRGYFSKNTILGQERFLPDGIIEKWSMLLEG